MYGGKKQNFVVSVLVAKFFVHNPDSVNYINNKRDDNDYRNLEWVAQSENISYAYKYGGLSSKRCAIIQYDNLFNPLNRVDSINEAVRLINGAVRLINGDPLGISQVCNGLMEHYYGFRWKYDGLIDNINLSSNNNSADVQLTTNKYLTLVVNN